MAQGSDDESIQGLMFARSGTRLVALGYSSNEARIFRTFHDQQLGFDCDFTSTPSSDDQRCVPSAQVEVVYTDAACSEPAGWIEGWGGQPVERDIVSGRPHDVAPLCPGDAPPHRTAYRVGEQLSEETVGAPPIPLWRRSSEGCTVASPPGKVTPAVHRLLPLDEASLARGERRSVKVSDDLRLTRLIADDGAELNLGVTSADGTPCELQRGGECVPEPIARPGSAYEGHFWTALNADCTESAFNVPYPASCGVAKLGVQDDDVRPYKVWSLIQPSVAYGWQVATPATDPVSFSCQPLASEDGQLTAPDRDLTGTFPRANKLRRGTGAIHVDWHSVGENELLPVLLDWRHASPGIVPTAQFVNDAGKVCQILPAEDGALRCAMVDEQGEIVGDPRAYPEVLEIPL
jgi:hypothetical protein